jgi:transcriptional regulator with XRE-family HTH domain
MCSAGSAFRGCRSGSTALHTAPHPATERLGLSNRELATITGVSEASISRPRQGRMVDPASKEGALALLLVRLYRSLGGHIPQQLFSRTQLLVDGVLPAVAG